MKDHVQQNIKVNIMYKVSKEISMKCVVVRVELWSCSYPDKPKYIYNPPGKGTNPSVVRGF